MKYMVNIFFEYVLLITCNCKDLCVHLNGFYVRSVCNANLLFGSNCSVSPLVSLHGALPSSLAYFPAVVCSDMSLCVPAFLPVVWRVWEEGNEGPIAAKPDSQTLFDFTVMSYNILAQDLLEANQELYTHCPLEVLEWTYRYYNLIEEILKWEPDVSEKHILIIGRLKSRMCIE